MGRCQICTRGQNCTKIFLHREALYKRLELVKKKKTRRRKLRINQISHVLNTEVIR